MCAAAVSVPAVGSGGVRRHAVVLACLAVAALVYAWPLPSRLTVSIPGRPNLADVTEYVWSVGWVQRVLNGRGGLWRTELVFVPYGADLRLNTFGLLQAIVAYPFTAWLGVVGAFNLVFLGTIFLNGVATYALVWSLTGFRLPALLAAVSEMFVGPLLGQLTVGRSALSALWIVAGGLTALRSLLRAPRLWKGVVLGLFGAAAVFTDFQIMLFSLLWWGLYGLGWLSRERGAIWHAGRLVALATAVALTAAPFLFIYFPALAGTQAAGYPQLTLKATQPYSLRYFDFANLRLWPLILAGYELLLAVPLALWMLRGRHQHLFWLAGAAFFFVLSLGPYLQPTNIPLPLAALALWPPLMQFRTPYRMAIPATIGLSANLGLWLAAWLPNLLARWRAWVVALAGVALVAQVAYARHVNPLPVQTYADYAFYHRVAQEPGDFSLLEVPFSVRSGVQRIGNGGEVVQYYQHIHGKALLNGSMARLPTPLFDFYRTHPALLFLSDGDSRGDPAAVSADFAGVLDWSRAGYVVVHRSLLAATQADAIVSFLQDQPALAEPQIEQDLVIFKVK
jgi:hypothetical protein